MSLYGSRQDYSQVNHGYEMTPFDASRSHDTLAYPEGDASTKFYDEISSIQDELRTFNANVLKISELHTRSLNSIDDEAARRTTGQLEGLVDQTRSLSSELRNRIRAIEKKGGDAGKTQQISFIKSKFMESIQGYQQVEREYRSKYKQRIERQYKIVKPDASPEEVKAVVESDDVQVFQQELLNSNRLGESRAAYREVQARHADIKKIEKTLIELAQLFQDMSLEVEKQSETIDVIHNNVVDVDRNVEAGYMDTTTAVKSAAGARRKRWICFWISVVVVIVVILIILFTVRPWQIKQAVDDINNNGKK